MTLLTDSASVAQYLAEHPDFFQEHLPLLAQMQLPSPLTGRAVSLQERQMEVLREKYRVLELKLAELMRVAQENSVIVRNFKSWTQAMLLSRNDVDLPHALTHGLQTIFEVPYASLRMWRVAPGYSHTWFAQEVSDDIKLFAASMSAPYCGANRDFEAVSWLEADKPVLSLAMMPLRLDGAPEAFGMLVIGSHDPERFAAGLATDFLVDVAETASAALNCLLD